MAKKTATAQRKRRRNVKRVGDFVVRAKPGVASDVSWNAPLYPEPDVIIEYRPRKKLPR